MKRWKRFAAAFLTCAFVLTSAGCFEKIDTSLPSSAVSADREQNAPASSSESEVFESSESAAPSESVPSEVPSSQESSSEESAAPPEESQQPVPPVTSEENASSAADPAIPETVPTTGLIPSPDIRLPDTSGDSWVRPTWSKVKKYNGTDIHYGRAARFDWMFDSSTGIVEIAPGAVYPLPAPSDPAFKSFSSRITQIREAAPLTETSGEWFGLTWSINNMVLPTQVNIGGDGEIIAGNVLVASHERIRQIGAIHFGCSVTGGFDELNGLDQITSVYLGCGAGSDDSYSFSASGYRVCPENSELTIYKGMVYSADFTELVACPTGLQDPEFHPDTRIIGAGALDGFEIRSADPMVTLTLPWGITSVESPVRTICYVAFPATVTSIPPGDGDRYVCPYYNVPLRTAVESTRILSWVYAHSGPKHHVWQDFYGLSCGWHTINGKKYYFIEAPGWYGRTEPRPVTGRYTIGGTTYIFDDSGALTGEIPASPGPCQWVEKNGARFYHGSDNRPVTGWQEIDGAVYLFDEQGRMVTSSWVTREGENYYLSSGGTMLRDYWMRKDGEMCYLTEDGSAARNEWVGRMGLWYYFDDNCAMVTEQWLVCENGKRYYASDTGAMTRNALIRSPEGQRWVDRDFAAVTDTVVSWGGKEFVINKDGILVETREKKK
ncbi:MAG: hypothetical protein IKM31_04395 [Oscillospiraceae bacterium]|nr:hypothetical protein [Oscillospiraceae bacterium]